MRIAIALLIGYLLGSVLPADLLARARGIDIREVGTRNPGTTNALNELGLVPGTITLLYDASVGLLAMYVAHLLGLSAGWTYIAGLSAVLGHIFPVFFGFRGGQGMAATTAMLIFEMGAGVMRGWLTVPEIALLTVVALFVYALTRSATDVGVFVAPLLVAQIWLSRPDWQYGAFMTVLGALIWVVQVGVARERDLFHFADPVRSRIARLRLRPR